MVNEALRGETLRSWLSTHGRLDPEPAARFAALLTNAVAYLHCQGLVHKNISPGTVFVCGDPPEPKLFDASLSLLRTGAATRPLPSCTLLEPEYMAPERILGSRADERSDLYSLGILFYELLSGERPFPGRQEEIYRQHLGAPVPRLPFEAGPWQAVIEGCLAKEPSERFPDAGALQQALEALVMGDPEIEQKRRPAAAKEPTRALALREASVAFWPVRSSTRLLCLLALLSPLAAAATWGIATRLARPPAVPPPAAATPLPAPAAAPLPPQPLADSSLAPTPELAAPKAAPARIKHKRTHRSHR